MKEAEGRFEQILEIAQRLENRKSDLQVAAAADAGFPVSVTGMEVDLAVGYLRSMEDEIPWIENRRPYGVVAAIFPYDGHAVMLGRLGGAAMITGNSLRFSFSSHTPRVAGVMAEICKPVRALDPVVGMNNREFGEQCVEDHDVRVLFMSGGSEVGQAYRGRREAFDKVFFAGPGGMPAAVVFQDAEVEKASRFIARRAFVNGGQYCTTLKKALIHRSLYDAVRNRVLEIAAQLRVGDPLDPDTDIGPIRVQRTRLSLERAIQSCSQARLLCGTVNSETVHPIIFEAESDWTIPDLELFGPFLVLKPFDDPETAVHELIATRYGFLISFFGSATRDYLRLFRENYGMVYDNPDYLLSPLRAAFGGKKESGWIMERIDGRWTTRDGDFYYSRELVRPQ
ncbi:MAG: aldehyde dehydrogenase family protein [Syntrophobacteraceae bacterium]